MAKGDFLGEFEYIVMLSLLRLGEDAYGMTIRQDIEDRAEPVAVGAAAVLSGSFDIGSGSGSASGTIGTGDGFGVHVRVCRNYAACDSDPRIALKNAYAKAKAEISFLPDVY